jgi:hypothetical protein
MRGRIAKTAGIVALMGIVSASIMAQAGEPRHMENAYRSLKRAHYILIHASHHLGGHRLAAQKQVVAALDQVKLAISADHGTVPEISESETPMVKTSELKHHPYVRDAIRQCQDALKDLNAAAQDPAGHRAKAVEHVNAALAELQQAENEPVQ